MHYVEDYSIKLAYFIHHLNAEIFYEMTENVNLKAQLGENCVPPQVELPPKCIPILLLWISLYNLV